MFSQVHHVRRSLACVEALEKFGDAYVELLQLLTALFLIGRHVELNIEEVVDQLVRALAFDAQVLYKNVVLANVLRDARQQPCILTNFRFKLDSAFLKLGKLFIVLCSQAHNVLLVFLLGVDD